MLTATYSIVAMSVEQSSVRTSVHALHQLVHGTFEPEEALSPRQVDYACEAMQRLYDAFGWRKVEQFLIPALRKVTRAADRLLEELDRVKLAAADTMGALFERVRNYGVESPAQVQHFCSEADAFCNALLTRLEREERELFPIARAALSSEAWFAIANQIIVRERDRPAPAAPFLMRPTPEAAAPPGEEHARVPQPVH
ncbi:MAG TPA: hypothetical protein VFF16_01270 [Telluria sp.]|nr:hypothetical protein [Telluria sp.]